jgi:hypothetical protein
LHASLAPRRPITDAAVAGSKRKNPTEEGGVFWAAFNLANLAECTAFEWIVQ